jgi:hypothetical protein
MSEVKTCNICFLSLASVTQHDVSSSTYFPKNVGILFFLWINNE